MFDKSFKLNEFNFSLVRTVKVWITDVITFNSSKNWQIGEAVKCEFSRYKYDTIYFTEE